MFQTHEFSPKYLVTSCTKEVRLCLLFFLLHFIFCLFSFSAALLSWSLVICPARAILCSRYKGHGKVKLT